MRAERNYIHRLFFVNTLQHRKYFPAVLSNNRSCRSAIYPQSKTTVIFVNVA